MVKECIANNGISLDVSCYLFVSMIFARKKIEGGFGVFANKPTVHIACGSRGRVCGCDCRR